MRHSFALLAVALVCIAPAPAADERPIGLAVPGIAVVREWGDLLAQPVITLGAGVRVRLGLESATCAAGSGVLLYCLAEGFAVATTGTGDDHLGPVIISLAVDGVPEPKTGIAWSRDASEPRRDARDVPLFARMIPIMKPAAYEVTITDAGGRLLASASVAAKTVDPNPWTSLGTSRSANAERRELAPALADSTSSIPCGFVGSIRALPACDGLEALGWFQPGKDDQVRQLLPRLLPTTPDPRLTLSRTDGRLVLDSAVPLAICADSMPMLMRWWVNDRPLVLASATPPDSNSGAIIDALKVMLDCDLDPGVLGAKPGDRIAVQFLYCPSGWVPCNQWMLPELAKRATMAGSDLPPTLLSKRLEFTFP